MLEDLRPPIAKRSCKVATVLETLNDNDKAVLIKAIFSSEWPIRSLSRALGERGIQLSDTPLTNHRAKACVCFG